MGPPAMTFINANYLDDGNYGDNNNKTITNTPITKNIANN